MNDKKENPDLVLVTGGTGFIGSHCVLELLRAGYCVRTTVRSLDREEELRAMMVAGGVEPGDRLTLVVANLNSDEGWAEAVRGCRYVLHVASPFPFGQPEDEEDLIRPAREGTLRVLEAARDAGVERIVVTSSFAAIGMGDAQPGHVFTEEDWTDAGGPRVGAYVKSKTLAERAAWDFVEAEGKGMELAVVNPVMVFGPVLGPSLGTSAGIIQGIMNGSITEFRISHFSAVDVRDVADLHLRAMTDPAAAGERFLAVAGDPISLSDIASTIRNGMGDAGARVADIQVPEDASAPRRGSNEKARRVLGWSPRSNEESVLGTAESLLRFDLV